MKTKSIKRAAQDSGMTETLIRAVIRQLGGRDCLSDIARHGADAGWPGFSYYTDTVSFFKRNRRAIVELVERMAEDLGESPPDLVTGFNCLGGRDRAKRSEHLPSVCRCLYGRIGENDTTEANALAWFALEEVARTFED